MQKIKAISQILLGTSKNLLRVRLAAPSGARNAHVSFIHSASCAPVVTTNHPLATIVRGALLTIFISFAAAFRPANAGEDVSQTFRAKSYPGSKDREYIVHLPTGYDGAKPIPLVMVLHGCKQTHLTIKHDSNFDAIADREGFMVVYPFITSFDGLRNTNCWGFWFDAEIHEGAGEVQDLWSLIEEVQSDYNIDPSRIHVTGLSSGAAMAIAVMVAHAEGIASGAETAGLPYSETSASVGFSCFNPGTFKPVSAIADAIDREMGAEKRPVPIFIVHSRDDCTVNIKAAESARDSWGRIYGVDTTNPVSMQSGTTRGTPWTHLKYPALDGQTIIETFIVSGKDHGWYGGRNGEFAFADAPNTAQLMWEFFEAHPLQANAPPAVAIDRSFAHDDRCITVSGTAEDRDGSIVSVTVAFTGVYPQNAQSAELAGRAYTFTVCRLRDDAAYTPLVEAIDDDGGRASVRGDAVIVGEPPANLPPSITIEEQNVDGGCIVIRGSASDDDEVVSVEARIGAMGWRAVDLKDGRWTYQACGLRAGTYTSAARATDNEGLLASVSGEEVVVEIAYDGMERSSLSGHVAARRVRYYPIGFGTADASYVDLLRRHGVAEAFPLYSFQGDWYADPGNIPSAAGKQ